MIFYISIFLNLLLLLLLIFFIKRGKDKKDQSALIGNEFLATQKKLKNFDIEKQEFVDIITHEISTPLASTAGYLSIILEMPEEEIRPEILNIVKKSFDSTKRMRKIIEDLLASSSSIGEEKVQAIQIENIITEVIKDFEIFAKDKDLELRFKLPKIMPLPLVLADPLSLRIILNNLIDNALKFTKAGEITIDIEDIKDYLKIEVKDTGVGLKKENMEKIFDKFYQADSSHTREVGGTGMGLYIVKNLIEREGGKIWVESIEGKGTVFSFTLPKNSS